MLIEEVLEIQKRNYILEKEILSKFSEVLKPYISLKNIQDKLEQTGFNGVYMLDSDLFRSITQNVDTLGLYTSKEKVIIIDKECYNRDKGIGIHEMGHAFLDNDSNKEIIIDDHHMIYGKGLGEGAMAILGTNLNIKKLDKIDYKLYPEQSMIFKQLNVLYNYSNIKEYENLLIHLFMKPKKFLSLIKDIYEDIYLNKLPSFDVNLAVKSAFAMVSSTDALLENNDDQLSIFLSYVNSLYLNIVNKNEEIENKLFLTSKAFEKTSEEKIISAIFNSDISYMKRLELYLDILLSEISKRLEKFDNNVKNEKSKILLPS